MFNVIALKTKKDGNLKCWHFFTSPRSQSKILIPEAKKKCFVFLLKFLATNFYTKNY